MNKRKFGRTNLHVSELCLNTAKFGWMDEEMSLALLDAYYSCGGSFIQCLAPQPDTSESEATHSENVVARWLKTRGIDRASLTLATRMNMLRPAHGGTIAFANTIRESCERSLRRLRTTHIDMLICDWDEQLLPVDDVVETLDMLMRAGLVRYAVAGCFPPWRLVDSLHRATARNLARFEGLQMEYSLMTRPVFEGEARGMCHEYRLGFLARSPLAGGFLAKRLDSIRDTLNPERSWLNERFGSQAGDAVLRELAEIAEKRLAASAQIALSWVLRNPRVSSAVISPADTDALRELARATQIALSNDEVSALAAVTTVQDHRLELRHI